MRLGFTVQRYDMFLIFCFHKLRRYFHFLPKTFIPIAMVFLMIVRDDGRSTHRDLGARLPLMLKSELFQLVFLFLCSLFLLFSISCIIWAHIFTVLRSLFATPTYPPETVNRGGWSVPAVQVSDSVRYSPFQETHLQYV